MYSSSGTVWPDFKDKYDFTLQKYTFFGQQNALEVLISWQIIFLSMYDLSLISVLKHQFGDKIIDV